MSRSICLFLFDFYTKILLIRFGSHGNFDYRLFYGRFGIMAKRKKSVLIA